MLYFQEMLGIAVFSITGVLAIQKADVDLFGAVVLGIITAIGAGSTDLLDCRLQLHLGGPDCCTDGVFSYPTITTTVPPTALSRWIGCGPIWVGCYRESAGVASRRATGSDDGRADQHWRRYSTRRLGWKGLAIDVA